MELLPLNCILKEEGDYSGEKEWHNGHTAKKDVVVVSVVIQKLAVLGVVCYLQQIPFLFKLCESHIVSKISSIIDVQCLAVATHGAFLVGLLFLGVLPSSHLELIESSEVLEFCVTVFNSGHTEGQHCRVVVVLIEEAKKDHT